MPDRKSGPQREADTGGDGHPAVRQRENFRRDSSPQFHLAVDRGDTQQFRLRQVQKQQQRQDIVDILADVGVENHSVEFRHLVFLTPVTSLLGPVHVDQHQLIVGGCSQQHSQQP